MTKVFFCRMNLYKVFHRIFFLFVKAWYLLGKCRAFVIVNFYSLSFSASVCLFLVNILIFTYGCTPFHSKVFSLNLPHGYLPTFPNHFFLSSSHRNQSGDSHSSLDVYLSDNVVHDSLVQPLPPVVHLVFCHHGPFTFANYLSVVSAFKMFKPSVLYIHLKHEPEMDYHGYFQFLPDLIRDIPVLSKKQLEFPLACTGSIQEQQIAFFNIIGPNGGIVINGKTVLVPSKLFRGLLDHKLGIAFFHDVELLLITFAHPDVFKTIPSQREFNAFIRKNKPHQMKCQPASDFSFHKDHLCVFVSEDIFPVQIFKNEEDFAAVARWTGYGTSEILVSQPGDEEIVPNIIHYVWLGKRNFDFFAYLSLVSSLHVLGADAVYIHGEEPLGELWAMIKRDSRVKVISRDFPNSVYGEPLVKFVSHASDYLRADVLLRYGGVYADWDVIFLQKLPSLVRRHNATACVDWPATGSFPDVFNLGVLVAAPGSPYLRFFLESYRWYLDNDWSYNAIHMPYKVYEKNPQTLNVDRHLQVLCAHDKCHAAWIPGYKGNQEDHLHCQNFNWHTDAVAIHWTHPDPAAFKDLKTLMTSVSVEADIAKFVLRKAKLIS